MAGVLRDSFVGTTLYYLSGHKIFQHPEDKPDFEIPEKYRLREKSSSQVRSPPSPSPSASRSQNQNEHQDQNDNQEGGLEEPLEGNRTRVERSSSQGSASTAVDETANVDNHGENGEEKVDERDIVTWYGPDDPENPQNWSLLKKCWTTFTIMLMTSSVYMGSSIYSPAIQQTTEYFGLGQVTVTLGLSLFVAGYGIGPLFLSPITEIPQIGRTIPYIVTLAIFTVLQVPTALVTNFAGFAILRFLAGFVGSPPLATGGASLQDIFSPHKLPYAMGLYGLSAASAPALAPVVSGFAVAAKGWRWAFWEMLWLSGFTTVLLSFTLPETSGNTILLRRAQRLRKLTNNPNLKSQSEIDSSKMTPSQIATMTLIRPFSMTFTEPIVLAINLYIGLIYAILYSYFESFPLVYLKGYGFSPGVSNLPFLALMVGCVISYAGYCIWNRLYFEPRYFHMRGKVLPESRLPMAMAGGFCFPICLFWFAWTSNRTHWISPVIASSFFGLGATWMFMPFLTYLPHAYPEYAASVLASNDFFRSMMGAGMPLAANPLFGNLGVDWGNTLLGCITVLFIPIPFVLYRYGGALRAKSPRALQDDQIKSMPDDPQSVRHGEAHGYERWDSRL